MAVRIRFKRTGRRNRCFYRLGAFDTRTRRDGRAIEELGHYDPIEKDDARKYVLDRERIGYWLSQGALPSETVQAILLAQGIDVPTSGKKRALSPEERAEREQLRKEKQQKREESIARKQLREAATKTAMTKKERREARKAGG